MENLINILRGPWHWSISGAGIAFVLFMLTWMGRKFGVSSIFMDACNIAGAGKKYEIFKYDLKNSYWRIVFVGGALVGGIISGTVLANPELIDISQSTVDHFNNKLGINYNEEGGFLPEGIFNLKNIKGAIFALVGGFLVGFGTRYAGGCTSGHAITGLSHLQLPSLLTVIGFFIGGLLMTWVIMPLIF